MTGSIYVLRNKTNGKCYVGQTTKSVEKRLYFHGKEKKSVLGKALRKYGRDNFEKFCTHGVPIWFLDEFEIAMIAKVGSLAPGGYNLHLGGQKNRVFSKATCAKISASKKGQKPWITGRKHTDEARAKMSAALKGRKVWNKGVSPKPESIEKGRQKMLGRKHTEEHKRKISESAKRHVKTPEHIANAAAAQRGKTVSAEARANMSAAAMGKIPWNKGVPNKYRGIPRSEEAKENIRAGIAAAKARRRENDQ